MRSSPLLAAMLGLLAAPSLAATEGRTAEPPPAEGTSGAWLSAVQGRIAEAEYEVSWQGRTPFSDLPAAWQAPNRAHGFRTYFTDEGVRVVPRIGEPPAWEWRLALDGYGRGRRVGPVAPAVLSVRAQRVTYDRGPVVEWYVNDPRGLEQGFTLHAPPEDVHAWTTPRRAGETVRLDLSLSGTLAPRIAADRQAIDFVLPSGAPALRYAGLLVTDAAGRELPARMEAYRGRGTHGIRLEFEDADAVYPVTVDPLATSPAWSAEGDQAAAELGSAVGTAGDVNGDGFADVIVGAPQFDNGSADEGRVFVYHGSAGGPSLTADWTAEADVADARFGAAVGTAGDVDGDGFSDVIVGAPGYANGQSAEGGAFVYHGSTSGLDLGGARPSGTPANADWSAESDQADAGFGGSAGTAGDVNGDGFSDVIVGADAYDNGQVDEGRVFVYHGSAAGLSATADWTAESDQAGAGFGVAAATAGDVDGDGFSDAIVGAHLWDNGETDEGGAFVYHGSATGLDLNGTRTSGTPANADWQDESDQASAGFGIAVGTAGDVNGDGFSDAIVGAHLFDGGNTDEGRAYAYHGSVGGLSPGENWSAEGAQDAAFFGRSVGTAGDVNGDGYADAIVGANGYDGGEVDEGRAYAYHGSASGLGLTEDWTVEPDQAGAELGLGAATAGDVDGDGFSDVIVGARRYDGGQIDEGLARVYRGGATGPSMTAGWDDEGDQNSAQFGYSVASAGDVNGDGFADVLVGASLFDAGQSNEGRLFVYHGSSTGPSLTADWTAESNQIQAELGWSVAAAGDVNGDGYGDVIVGVHRWDGGQTDEGAVFVYHGSATGLDLNGTRPAGDPLNADWTAESDQANARFGHSVASAGDVNGDAWSDVIVGAHLYGDAQSDEGRAFVYHGSTTGLDLDGARPGGNPLNADWRVEGNQVSAQLGHSVASAGDVNGDGFSDVVVGAWFYDNGVTDEGAAFVYHGSGQGGLGLDGTRPVGDPSNADWSAEGEQLGARFGVAVAGAGDVNGDGYADLIVGADFYDSGQINEGAAFVYHGSATGLDLGGARPGGTPANADWAVESDQASAEFGWSVAGAGDVNGDGFADVIVGAFQYDAGESDEGRAFAYLGSASGLSTIASWTAESNQASARFGRSTASAGDVNGDGFADVVVGAHFFNGGDVQEGRADLYFGNGGPGVSLIPQQRRADDTGPIAPLGTSEQPDRFRLAALGRSPAGRARVKLEWEVKPLGALFDGSGTGVSAGWLDTGTAGVQLDELVTGLAAGSGYHWRARLLYETPRSPFAQASRWFTEPRNGWQEKDLRTRREADLAVTQSDAVDPVVFDDDIVYSVTVTNNGPDDADAELTDTLPAGSTLVSAVPTQGTCNEAGGVVTCDLGTILPAGNAVVTVTVTPGAPGAVTNDVVVEATTDVIRDPVAANDSASEPTTVLNPSIGDRVWEDLDGDGIQDAGEPGVVSANVYLFNGGGTLIDVTFTDTNGNYSFTVNPGDWFVRFIPPPGYVLSPQDQGGDDGLDSDADPATGNTPVFTVGGAIDTVRWDAGVVPQIPCMPPDEPIWIYEMTVSTDGNDYPILHFQDPNQPDQITGYNVYRSSDPAPPPSTWPLVASDVVDMDEATPNKQWTDTSGDVSPSGIWYYQVTAYNNRCPAEGPF